MTTQETRRADEQPTPPRGYQPPRLNRLGTLAELTQGGDLPIGDGTGGTGASI
ncbi:lasso RiPP family leader peptide-containing protein [Micromonospora sp. R77]|uniref:lasso RiPP family leader peptide-containing protein n=1 Tax=Micromonospora sp. R77 TaxID=2925836 RepID=UPI001F6099EE|nr:lasso RiPP family leader peptide-containing protein [Micromonospora sp. R77]MCI4064851.1 lasso RiPP family leader peptide-containing protein [Micromonospora sp. R77]